MATPIFICGAECGLNAAGTLGVATEHWSSTINTPTSETAPASRGGVAWRFNPAGGGEAATHTYATAVGSPATVVARFYIYFTTLPNADVRLFTLVGGVSPALAVVFKQSDSTLRAGGNTAALVAASGAAVTTGVWYRVDVKGVFGTTRTCDIQVDGNAQAQYSLGGQTATTSTSFTAGANDVTTCDCHIDDIEVSGTSGDYPIGEGKVAALYPNADGSHTYNAATDFQKGGTANTALATPSSAETTVYQSVQGPQSGGTLTLSTTIDTANFIQAVSAAVDGTEFLQLAFDDMPANTNTIDGLAVVSTHHSASATGNFQSLSLNDGGTLIAIHAALDFSEVTIVTAYKLRNTNGAGGAWTKTLLDALIVRWWATDVTPDAYLDGVCLEVSYTEAAAGPFVRPTILVLPSKAAQRASRW